MDDNIDSDPFFDIEDDIILGIKTQEHADRYVAMMKHHLDQNTFESMFEDFVGVTPMQLHQEFVMKCDHHESPTKLQSLTTSGVSQPIASFGGQIELDIRVYRLFELIDSLHDFGQSTVDQDTLQNDLKAELPFLHKNRESGSRYEQLNLDELSSGTESRCNLIGDLTSNETLYFESTSEYCNNPVFGKNFEAGMFTSVINGTDINDAYERHLRDSHIGAHCTHSEIWCFANNDLQFLKFRQLAKALNDLRNAFGYEQTFIVDEAKPITSLLLAGNLLIKSFMKTVRLEEFDEHVSAHRLRWWLIWIELTTRWNLRTCDAGLMDAASHNFPLDDRPTGKVFRDDSIVQIDLVSSQITSYQKRTKTRYNKSYEYTISSNESPLSLSDLESKQDTRHVINDFIKVNIDAMYSSDRMIRVVNQYDDQGHNVAVPLALKRAGDWGQIEHCKKYDCVFVTGDAIAALYATLRNVPFLYVNTWRAPNRSMTDNIFEVDGLSGDLYRHSFSMFNPPWYRVYP